MYWSHKSNLLFPLFCFLLLEAEEISGCFHQMTILDDDLVHRSFTVGNSRWICWMLWNFQSLMADDGRLLQAIML